MGVSGLKISQKTATTKLISRESICNSAMYDALLIRDTLIIIMILCSNDRLFYHQFL